MTHSLKVAIFIAKQFEQKITERKKKNKKYENKSPSSLVAMPGHTVTRAGRAGRSSKSEDWWRRWESNPCPHCCRTKALHA